MGGGAAQLCTSGLRARTFALGVFRETHRSDFPEGWAGVEWGSEQGRRGAEEASTAVSGDEPRMH